MRLPAPWWRDRVRCCSGRIEEFGGDLLIAPGPATGEWLLRADRDPEPGQALARGVRVLRCARPPPGGNDPIAYPGICAEDWYEVALEAAAGEGATTVLLPPLGHPEGDAGIAEGAMVSISRGLARHPSIQRLWIVCAEEATADRWRAALFAAGRSHPCPGIAAGLMRVACADGGDPVLPEACYRDRAPGCVQSDRSLVYYQFREGDGGLRLEVCETAGPERSGRRFIVESDGTDFGLPPLLGRRQRRWERGAASPSCVLRRSSRRRGFSRRDPVKDEAADRNGLRVATGEPRRATADHARSVNRDQARSNGRWNSSIDHPR